MAWSVQVCIEKLFFYASITIGVGGEAVVKYKMFSFSSVQCVNLHRRMFLTPTPWRWISGAKIS